MKRRYRIAELNCEVDCDYPRTIRQAEAYRLDFEGEAQISIQNQKDLALERQRQTPDFSLDDWEYMLTCQAFYEALLHFDGMMVHSSCVVKDGLAYLFSADSGTGKSTHTQLWLKRFPDAYILNDDKPAVRFVEGALYAYGTPWSGKSDLNVNRKVPVGGLILLQRSEENWVRPASGSAMVNCLLKQTLRFLPADLMERMLRMADVILSNTRVLDFGCNISSDAVDTIYRALTEKES